MPDNTAAQLKAAYDKLCLKPSTSIFLKEPTPANLRKQCIRILRERNSAKDRYIIAQFLDIDIAAGNLETSIRNADIEKFKPVANFLRGKTRIPHYNTEAFVEWLIGFGLKEQAEKEKPAVVTAAGQLNKNSPEQGCLDTFMVKIWVPAILIMLFAAGVYWSRAKRDFSG